MAHAVSVTPKALDVNTPEGLEHAIEFCSYMVGYAERDCRPLASKCLELKINDRFAAAIEGELNWERFCKEILGTNADFIDKIIEGVEFLEGRGVTRAIKGSEALAALDAKDQMERVGQGPPKGNQNASKTNRDNITNSFNERDYQGENSRRPNGTTVQAGLRRLRKDAPDLHQQVLNGDLSVHSACVKAGFRSPTITIPIDPERAAKAILKRFGAEEIRQLIELLQTGG